MHGPDTKPDDERLRPLLREIRSATLRWLTRLAALAVVGTVLLGAVLPFTPVRLPLTGGEVGLELIDVGSIPGSGPRPGWYSGTLSANTGTIPGAPTGAYSAWYGREWGLMLQFANPGVTRQRWKQPTRFITEHPLALMLLRRVQSGRLNRERLQRLLGPPAHSLAAGTEWRYEYADWTGGFLFVFDRHGTARRLDFGSG